jgi:hypothetical protein
MPRRKHSRDTIAGIFLKKYFISLLFVATGLQSWQ